MIIFYFGDNRDGISCQKTHKFIYLLTKLILCLQNKRLLKFLNRDKDFNKKN